MIEDLKKKNHELEANEIGDIEKLKKQREKLIDKMNNKTIPEEELIISEQEEVQKSIQNIQQDISSKTQENILNKNVEPKSTKTIPQEELLIF